MGLFQKNRWLEWARAWGLTHYPQRGLFYRNEQVTGLRKGYLVSASWGGQKQASLILRIRFPGGADLESIRRTLADDASLDALPGKGKGRAKTVLAVGPEKKVQLGAIPEFTLRDGSLIWFRTYAWAPPKTEQLTGWIDALIASISRATPAFDGRCEQCHTTQVRQFVFVDQVPKMLCGTCQERLRTEREMAERNYDMMDARHLNGFAFALVAAVVGAAGWALVAALTNRILAMAAIGMGALIAFAYRKGAGRVDLTGQIIGATLTVLSVAIGQLLFYAWSFAQARPDIGFHLTAGCLVYQHLWKTDPGTEIIALVFGLAGAFVSFGMLQRRPQGAVIRQADEDPRDRVKKAA